MPVFGGSYVALLATGLVVTLGGLGACQLAQLIAPPQPSRLIVSPPSLEDSAVAGTGTSVSRDLTVQSEGDSLGWNARVAAGSSWISLKRSNAPGPAILGLTLASGTLAPGTYSDTLVISPETFEEETVRVPVTFNVRAGVPGVAFTTQPSSVRAGSNISPAVEVTARDGAGRTMTSFTGVVTMTIATNPVGGTLSGTRTAAAVAGIARFSSLRIDRVGNGYTLRASASLGTATSNAFNVTASSPVAEVLP